MGNARERRLRRSTGFEVRFGAETMDIGGFYAAPVEKRKRRERLFDVKPEI